MALARDDASRGHAPAEGSTGDPWRPALERVLRGQGFALAFQPIVDLQHGSAAGYEAVARFEPPEGIDDAATPAWFEAARRLGVGAELEARIVGAALDARDRLPPNTFITINLSPWAVDSSPVRRVLEGPRGLHRVVLQLTADTSAHDEGAQYEGAQYEGVQYEGVLAEGVLEEAFVSLRGRGAYLAVGGVSASHASLSDILRLRPDFVKLHRDLIVGVDHDEANLALVEMSARFAARVDAWLVADGVAASAELATLARLGVPLAQGEFLGRAAVNWTVLAPEVRQQLLRSAAAAEDRHTLEPFVEPWPFLEEGRELEGLQLLREALEPGSHMLSSLPVLDRYRRPVAIYSVADHSAMGARPARAIMQVKATTRISDAARRAMTRPFPRRFDPMACVDEAGTYLGIVRVERLIEVLTALDGDSGRHRNVA